MTKLSFPRQNLLSHDKTYFSMAKLTFSRQNLLSHDKTYFSTAKFYTAKELGRDPSTIKMATANDDNANEDGDTEEVLITYYFYRGYQYRDILDFLATYHNIEMSERTLHRRLRTYGLSRRNPEYDVNTIVDEVQGMLDGPDCISGYRHVWHSLQLKGLQVPRRVVEIILRELDPDRCRSRRGHKLKRREYHNPGPNAVWRADGYDKFKPYGFPVHGCIDGWSRKLLWLVVTRSNNSPDNIGSYFLDAVKTCGGCPCELVTDLGTENKTMACKHFFVTMKTRTNMLHRHEIKESKVTGHSIEETGQLGG